MPADMAVKSAALGAVNGFCTIGWIILNVLFLYRLTVEKGLFAVFQHSLGRITADRRLQILLIRLLLRRLLRRRGRLRHPGGGVCRPC